MRNGNYGVDPGGNTTNPSGLMYAFGGKLLAGSPGHYREPDAAILVPSRSFKHIGAYWRISENLLCCTYPITINAGLQNESNKKIYKFTRCLNPPLSPWP
jgi:hypothetical protein